MSALGFKVRVVNPCLCALLIHVRVQHLPNFWFMVVITTNVTFVCRKSKKEGDVFRCLSFSPWG